MPYFSSDKAKERATAFIPRPPAGSQRVEYSNEYTGAFKIIKAQPSESVTAPIFDTSAKDISSRKVTRFGVLRFSAVLFTAFILATHFASTDAPPFLQDAYMSAYNHFAPIYEQIYASAARADTQSVNDVSRETFAENSYLTQEEAATAVEEDAYTVPETSGLQRLVLEAAKPSEAEEATSVATEQKFDISFEEESVIPDANGIIGKDLSVGADRIYSMNETKLQPNLDALAVAAYPLERITDTDEGVRVLILHTHGTECYSDSESGGTRSTNRNENVVRVGKELAEVLNFHGITTVHSETMHDEKSYLTAYSSSKKEVRRLLELYPTVQYVIDLHRDAIPNDGTSRVKTSTVINGEETAQIMLVVGTNAGGGDHPNYEKNLTVASHLQKTLNELYPTLARPINIRNAIFNQSFSPGCLLLEVGSDANTLDEALRAARMFGEGLAREIKDNS